MEVRELETMILNRGVTVIGAQQRTIAFTAVASGGTGLLNFTAAAHGLKKYQDFYISTGAYQGSYKIKKVIDANTVQVAGTFGSTTSGILNLTVALDGEGFIVNQATGFAIAEFVPSDSTIDAAAVIAKVYVDAEKVPIQFKKLRITGGNAEVVRKTPQTDLHYTNR